MIDNSVPFEVRRARLRVGMTPMQLSEFLGVDVAVVYRWELGLACPSPDIWAQLRNDTLKASSFLDAELVKVSPLFKYIVAIDNLTKPIVASKGIIEALKAVGALEEEEDLPDDISEMARNSPHLAISGVRALEIIQADPRWHRGEIVYAEAHCLAPALGDVWMDGMIAPLPERIAAFMEFAPSRRGSEGGFWVHPVTLADMPFNQPQ